MKKKLVCCFGCACVMLLLFGCGNQIDEDRGGQASVMTNETAASEKENKVSAGVKDKKPFSELKTEDISSVSVTLLPPNKTIQISNINEFVQYLKDVVIYEKDNSYTEYNGQNVTFTIIMTDGTKTDIMAYNPFFVIDGVGYQTKYEPCEALNQYANELLQNEDSAAVLDRDEAAIKEYLLTFPNDSEQLKQLECYQIIHGEEASGREYWDEFYQSVQEEKPAQLTIANFTIEGDVILDYVNYDGNDFYLLSDSTRDRFAGELYWQETYKYLNVLDDRLGDRHILFTDGGLLSVEEYEKYYIEEDHDDLALEFYEWAYIENWQ